MADIDIEDVIKPLLDQLIDQAEGMGRLRARNDFLEETARDLRQKLQKAQADADRYAAAVASYQQSGQQDPAPSSQINQAAQGPA